MTTFRHGLAAEDAVARWYHARGAAPVASRWRCPAGEIDLIVRLGPTLVFVEVKTRRKLRDAAHAISQAQWARIMAAAECYLAENDLPLDTDLRFDAALLDRHGHLEVIENAAPV